jgi:PAS domain S-box-containing protein
VKALLQFLSSRPRSQVVWLCVLLLGLVTASDLLLTEDEGLATLLYVAPVALGAFFVSRPFGMLLALASAVGAYFGGGLGVAPHLAEFGVFAIVAALGSALRALTLNVQLAAESAGRAKDEAGEARDRLRASEAQARRMQRAIHQAHEAVLIADVRGTIEYVNPAFTRMTGYSAEEVVGQNTRLLKSGQQQASFYHELWKTVLAGEVWSNRIINRRKDGTLYTEEMSVTPVRDDAGQISHFIAIKQDVTERNRAAEALERMCFSIDHAVDFVVWADAAGRVVYANGAAHRSLGYTAQQVLELSVWDLSPSVASATWPERWQAIRQSGSITIQTQWRRHDGTTFPVEITISHVAFRGDEYHCVIGRDISTRLQLEQQLRQAQKMEAVGHLAGGVAHDFNNILGVVLGYTEMLQRDEAQDERARHKLEQIRKAGERGASLTRQLLAFSRKQVLQPKTLDLNVVVRDTEKMLQRLIGEDIQLSFAADRDLGTVKVDPSQIEQVLLNLAVNARDAMPGGGALTIATRNVEVSGGVTGTDGAVAPGRFVLLTVTDTGCGMDAETQKHVFEPFFTTKELGKGTGLGLATVYGVVKQSGGEISLHSEVGRGTTFKIYLPRIDEAIELPSALPALVTVPGSGTILLVEDEEPLRAIAQELLELSGYKVLPAANGAEGLSLSVLHRNGIDLLLADVVMPAMSGPELARNLQGRYPQLAVVYMSGYTDGAIAQHGVLEPGQRLITKPFSGEELTRVVAEALRARDGAS